jgi:hypothetical protein
MHWAEDDCFRREPPHRVNPGETYAANFVHVNEYALRRRQQGEQDGQIVDVWKFDSVPNQQRLEASVC